MYTDYPGKEGARTHVYDTLERGCSTRLAKRKVMILETSAASEVIHLVKRGYSPKNIYAINWNVGQIARANRMLHEQNIHGVNCLAGDLLGWAAYHRPHFINYDGCGPIGVNINRHIHSDDYIRALVNTLPTGGRLSCTFLMARDKNRKIFELLKSLDSYTARLAYWYDIIHSDGMPKINILGHFASNTASGHRMLYTQLERV